MRKVSVYIPAYGGCTVELQVQEHASDDEIIEQAYQEASLSDGELYDWDYEAELEIVEKDNGGV